MIFAGVIESKKTNQKHNALLVKHQCLGLERRDKSRYLTSEINFDTRSSDIAAEEIIVSDSHRKILC